AITRLLDALNAEDTDALSAAISDLADETARRKHHQHYLDFIVSVRQSAPKLADLIVAAEGADNIEAPLLEFEPAWRHRCAQSWLELVLSTEKVEATHRAMRDEMARLQELTSQLASARAWFEAI